MIMLTRELLEERLVALHRASIELVSDLSLDNVLERIIQIAREQAGARYAALGVVDEEGELTQFVHVGMSQDEVAEVGEPPVGRGLLGALKDERRTIRIHDIDKDPRSFGFPPGHPVMNSFLGVPIMLGDELLGRIYLTDKLDHFEFTEDDQRVIETLAAYAAVAVNNARMYQEMTERDLALTQRSEDLAFINEMATALASSLEIDEILRQTLERVMSHLDVKAGEIFLNEEGRQSLRLALRRGNTVSSFWTRERFRFGEGYIGIVAQTGKPLVRLDLRKNLRYLCPEVIDAGFCCMACVPLTAPGSVVGVLSVASDRKQRLDVREIKLLTAIGSWAGITIENARLHRQARRLAVLEERERIGMDLHDGIIQSIYGVGLLLDYASLAVEADPKLTKEKIEEAGKGLNQAISDIRSYIMDLRPRQFRGEDLMAGLMLLVEEFKANSAALGALVGPRDGLVSLSTVNATALFHICQEALANVAKHAHAKQAKVHLWTTNNRVLLEVVDDGSGFDINEASVTLGHGLSNMQVRAHKVGGDVEITSKPGEGTTVLAWVPWGSESVI
jgi:two-component system sensor histidine kinase DevS